MSTPKDTIITTSKQLFQCKYQFQDNNRTTNLAPHEQIGQQLPVGVSSKAIWTESTAALAAEWQRHTIGQASASGIDQLRFLQTNQGQPLAHGRSPSLFSSANPEFCTLSLAEEARYFTHLSIGRCQSSSSQSTFEGLSGLDEPGHTFLAGFLTPLSSTVPLEETPEIPSQNEASNSLESEYPSLCLGCRNGSNSERAVGSWASESYAQPEALQVEFLAQFEDELRWRHSLDPIAHFAAADQYTVGLSSSNCKWPSPEDTEQLVCEEQMIECSDNEILASPSAPVDSKIRQDEDSCPRQSSAPEIVGNKTANLASKAQPKKKRPDEISKSYKQRTKKFRCPFC